MQKFKTILCPIDTSPLAGRALDVAVSIAEKFDSKLILLEVRATAAPLSPGNPTETQAALDVIEHGTGQLMDVARAHLSDGHDLSSRDVSVEVRVGPVVATIVDAAAEHEVDLIVMGTHGRSGLTELFTGSTTEQVQAKTSASVLAVKPEGFPFLRS